VTICKTLSTVQVLVAKDLKLKRMLSKFVQLALASTSFLAVWPVIYRASSDKTICRYRSSVKQDRWFKKGEKICINVGSSVRSARSGGESKSINVLRHGARLEWLNTLVCECWHSTVILCTRTEPRSQCYRIYQRQMSFILVAFSVYRRKWAMAASQFIIHCHSVVRLT
jgi:hypothetical protein